MRKREYLCLIPLPFLISFLIQYAVVYLFNTLQISNRVTDETTYTMLFRVAVGCAYILIFGLWYLRCFGKTREIPLKKSLALNHILLLLAIAICGQVAISFVLNIILPLFKGAVEQYQAMMGSMFVITPLSVLYVAVLTPIGEECIFRGLTMKFAGKALPALAANLIQAALFGFYHMNLVQGIYAFVMGFVFGYAVLRLKSLWASIIMHVILNAVGLWMNANLDPDLPITTSAVICILSIAIVVISMYLLPILKTETHEES